MAPLARTVAVIYVLFAAIAVVAIDLRIVLIPAACASLILLGLGIAVFRRMAGAIALPWPAAESSADDDSMVIIEDTPLPFLGYEQELIIAVRTVHTLELAACSILAAAALYFMIFGSVGTNADGIQIGGFEAELICGAGLGVLIVSLRWFVERRILIGSRYTIGTFIGRDPGYFRRGITYQFFDHDGERRGGRGPFWGGLRDNAILVLYDPNEPDHNITHGAFLFHKFSLMLIPSRTRQA